MRLQEIYDAAVTAGMDADPRGPEGLQRVLAAARKAWEELPERRRWEFDQESLTNPFADTRILTGDPELEVERILAGIDMEVGEMLLADRLNERGQRIDLVLAHHPMGRALADLEAVMPVQADMWRRYGVPINYGEAVMADRMREIRRAFHAYNNEESLDAARLLGIAVMSCHTPADNCVQAYLQARCDALGEDATLGELLDMLKTIPEYQEAVKRGTGPILFQGEEERRAGRIMVGMTGGTSGPKEALRRLADAGVGTIVDMHMEDEHRKVAEEAHLNVVIAGHHASDSLGMNLIMDRFEKAGVEIIPCSGLIRVSRVDREER